MVEPNYYCLHCPHSRAMHQGDRLRCGGLDAAGDTCDCEPFVADTSRPPLLYRRPEVKIKKDIDWKKIALRFARSVIRFQNNDWTYNMPESTVLLARKIIKNR